MAFKLKAASVPVTNSAGSGIASIASNAFDLASNDFIFLTVGYEVANPTITINDNLGGQTWNALPKQHDAGDIKGHQCFWMQATAAKAGFVATASFSPSVGFASLILEREHVDGTVSLISQGTPFAATGVTAFTIPSVTGAMLHLASVKMFGSATINYAQPAPYPYGPLDGNASNAHKLLRSATPFSGTLAASGSMSSAQNILCTSASFADSGSPPSASVRPSWYDNAAPGTVVQIPGASALDSGISTNNGTTLSTDSVWSFWSGAVGVPNGLYVGTEQRPGWHLWITGSGHTQGNNEVLGYGPIQSEVPGFSRLRDNTIPIPTNVPFDGSGNPSATHSYQSKFWTSAGATDRVLAVGGQGVYSNASAITVPYSYNLAQSAPNINSPWSQTATTVNGWWFAAYDNGTAKAWGITDASLIHSYDPATDTYTSAYGVKTVPGRGTPMVVAVDQTRGLILYINGGSVVSMFRPSLAATTDFYTPTTTGTGPSTASAVVWDDVDDRFVVYEGNNTLRYLTPPATNPYAGGNAWTWSTETYGGATPGAPQTNGTYGRFAYVKQGLQRGYLLTNSYSTPVYMFRPSSALTGPVITAQPAGTFGSVGGTATFSYAALVGASPTYQAQRSTDLGVTWSNVSGATATSYTTPALTSADNGTLFRVVVTDALGSANSIAALLFVRDVNTGDGRRIGSSARWLRGRRGGRSSAAMLRPTLGQAAAEDTAFALAHTDFFFAPSSAVQLLAGAASASSSAAAALQLLVALQGAAVAAGAATGTLSTGGVASLAGAATGGASASGAIAKAVGLAGAATGQGAASSDLAKAVAMAIAAAGNAGVSGTLALSVPLAASAVAQAGATGALSTSALASLAGSAVALSGASGAVSLIVGMSAAASGGASASGAIAKISPLTATAAAAGTATGQLALSVPLAGAGVGQGAASGALAGSGTLLGGNAVGQATASGAAVLAISLAGVALTSSSAGGALAHTVPLSGAASALATSTGQIALTIVLAGAALTQATASGTLGGAVALSGSAAGAAGAQGALFLSVPLAGAALAQAQALGAITLTVLLGGSAQGSGVAAGNARVPVLLGGGAAAGGIVTGELSFAAAGAFKRALKVTSKARNWRVADAPRTWRVADAPRNWRVQ